MLFRLLTTKPRPVWPIEYRIRAAPRVALFVRGLRGREDAAAFCDDDGEHPEVWSGLAARRLVTVALCDARARPHLRYQHTGKLTDDELTVLSLTVVRALNICSPALWRCNIDAWRKKLQGGAVHYSNIADMLAMAECSESLASGAKAWRPDRYYGMPVADLTDGQIMAYDAAHAAYRKRTPKGN